MDDSNKKQFWGMLNVTMELTNKPPLTKETILAWWTMLSNYEFEVVKKALNQWVDNSSKPPTPHDIKELCSHKVTIFAKIPSPLAIQDNKRHADNVVKFVADRLVSKTDYKAWAKRILSNPNQFPDKSVQYAKEALNVVD